MLVLVPACLTTLEYHPTVDPNVSFILNVQVTKLASMSNALTHAQGRVDQTLSAKFSTINQFVNVQLASLEIHSINVGGLWYNQLHLQPQKELIHAIQRHAEPMHSVEQSKEQERVHVSEAILVTHTLAADLSVSSTPTVPLIRHVSTRNVWTPVQGLAASMQSAIQFVISLSAHVWMDI
jgi:hypothetical protein